MIDSLPTLNASDQFAKDTEPDSASRLTIKPSLKNDIDSFSFETDLVGADGALSTLSEEESDDRRVQKRNQKLAVIAMNAHAVFFAMSNVGFKLLMPRGICIADLFLFRGIIMIFVTTLIMHVKKTTPTIMRPQARWLIARILAGLSGFGLFKITIGFLPLSLLMIVTQTTPFWTSLLSYLLIGE